MACLELGLEVGLMLGLQLGLELLELGLGPYFRVWVSDNVGELQSSPLIQYNVGF